MRGKERGGGGGWHWRGTHRPSGRSGVSGGGLEAGRWRRLAALPPEVESATAASSVSGGVEVGLCEGVVEQRRGGVRVFLDASITRAATVTSHAHLTGLGFQDLKHHYFSNLGFSDLKEPQE